MLLCKLRHASMNLCIPYCRFFSQVIQAPLS
jgi:hypothetical protein